MGKYQFIHIEAVSIAGRDVYKKTNGNKVKIGYVSVDSILGEAERIDGFISHVENPQKPVIIFGDNEKGMDEVREKIKNWFEGTKDKRGHKIRKDANCLLAGVISWPPIADDEDIDEYYQKLKSFEIHMIEWLKNEYGNDLISVIRHDDEPFKGYNKGKTHHHWHYFCVKEPGNKFDLHPGFKARAEYDVSRNERNKISKEELSDIYNEGKKAYNIAMKVFLDRFNVLSSKFGMERYGERRIRRSRTEQVELEKFVEKEIKDTKVNCNNIITKAKEEAENVKRDVKNKVNDILVNAKNEAVKIKNNAINEGKKEAFAIGNEIIKIANDKREEILLQMDKDKNNILSVIKIDLKKTNVPEPMKKETSNSFFIRISNWLKGIIKNLTDREVAIKKKEEEVKRKKIEVEAQLGRLVGDYGDEKKWKQALIMINSKLRDIQDKKERQEVLSHQTSHKPK